MRRPSPWYQSAPVRRLPVRWLPVRLSRSVPVSACLRWNAWPGYYLLYNFTFCGFGRFCDLVYVYSPSSGSEQTLTVGGGGPNSSTEQQLIEIEGPMLTETHTQFKLTTPSPMPQYLNVHYICESASRLLFLSMHWARSIPAFQALRWERGSNIFSVLWGSQVFSVLLQKCHQENKLLYISWS